MGNAHDKAVEKEIASNLTERPLTIGQILPNGGEVLEFKWRDSRGGELEGKHGIVLCLLRDNPMHPYVVWRFVFTYEADPYHPERTIYGVNCMHGDYHTSLTGAMKVYEKRNP